MACSIGVAPRPPYSFGQDTPAQPPSCSFRLPLEAEGECLLLVALRLLARMVRLQPRAQLVAEGFFVG